MDDECRKLSLEVLVSMCENAKGMMRKLQGFAQQIVFSVFKVSEG